MRKVLIVVALTVAALNIVVALTMVLGAASNSNGFPCDGQRVREGDDLAAAIKAAPGGTTFCVEAGTYPISETVDVQDGDVIRGEPGTITRRGPAVDPDPVVHVRNAKDLARMFHVTARTGRMEWLDIQGSPDGGRYTGDPRETCEHWGEASGRCPQVGTGVAVGAGQSGAEFVFEHLQVHDNPAQCISGLEGKLLRSELYHCSRNADLVRVARAVVELATKEFTLQAADALGRVIVHLQVFEDELGAALSRSYRHAGSNLRASAGGFPPVFAGLARVARVPPPVWAALDVQPLHATGTSGDVEHAGKVFCVADMNYRVGIDRGTATRNRAGLASNNVAVLHI